MADPADGAPRGGTLPERLRAEPSGGLGHWEGEPVRVWERVWDVPRFEAYRSVTSTNDVLRERAAGGAPPFSVAVADEQVAGRGRSGRRWSSPPGAGLWMSVLLRRPAGGDAPLLTLAVGVAVAEALEGVVGRGAPAMEWPNDILLGGRKVCGILCEGVAGADAGAEAGGGGAGVVAGIGVNLRQGPEDFPPELRERATSVEAFVGARVERGALAGAVLRELRRRVDPPPRRVEGGLARGLERLDALRGRRVRVEGVGTGVAEGIAADGALRVRTSGEGVRRIVAGTVRRAEAPGEEALNAEGER